jgi:histone H3/H4
VKPKIKLAVARVLALHAEFSPAELAEAYDYLENSSLGKNFGVCSKNPRPSDLMDKPIGIRSEQERSSASAHILNALQATDQEKYRLLDELERILRSNKPAIRMDEIRRIATSIDKEKDIGKSKKEAIPKLLEVLAANPIDDIRSFARPIFRKTLSRKESDDSYNKLAKYLVRGE